MKHKILILALALLGVVFASIAEIKVSDVEVFSGYPWKEVVVGYTITGTDASADFIRLTATDKSASKTYTAKTLTGAVLTEGRHLMRWNAAAEGVKFSSPNVVFNVSVMRYGGVQLWENGPYFAECNVGASKPEEYGYYFWWGDTVGYKRNASNTGWISVQDDSSFSFNSGNCPTHGKSNSQLKSVGYIDSTGNLVAAHDAATAHLGAPWRMPTNAEFASLISNCTITWTSRNGVTGQLVTGKGDYVTKSIFLPSAGYGSNSSFIKGGGSGHYWSSTPRLSSDGACHINFSSYGLQRDEYGNRYDGLSVRPVRGFAK